MGGLFFYCWWGYKCYKCYKYYRYFPITLITPIAPITPIFNSQQPQKTVLISGQNGVEKVWGK